MCPVIKKTHKIEYAFIMDIIIYFRSKWSKQGIKKIPVFPQFTVNSFYNSIHQTGYLQSNWKSKLYIWF